MMKTIEPIDVPEKGQQAPRPEIGIAAPAIDEAGKAAVMDVLNSGVLAQGPRVAEFEDAFASYIGTRHAIAVSSGTTALHLALLAAGVGPGDEVITTPFSFIATANAILYCGAKPVFVDIEEGTFNIDPCLIGGRITPRTKAILPVHLYGQSCALEKIVAMCSKRGLALIEDACQAHGAEYAGRRVGSFGTGCFSFYPTKNMTTGEGGMITTNDSGVAEKARILRAHGAGQRYHHTHLGYNYRMTDIAAALGITQLRRLDEFNSRRIANARALTAGIAGISSLQAPVEVGGTRHVFHQFTVRVRKGSPVTRDQLAMSLKEKGIASGVYYPLPIHKQPLYQKMGYVETLPVAEEASRQVLSLPVHPGLSRDDVERIVECLQDAF